MRVGIVGHEAAKFTEETERAARLAIRTILLAAVGAEKPVVVSGGCHLGGVDIWAIEEATSMLMRAIVHKPKALSWAKGYKPRNLLIARDSDEVHVIVVDTLPDGYAGMRFDYCYHCHTSDHIKSGGCWTAREASKLGKPAKWHVIRPEGAMTRTSSP